ncbi:hypothetical protein [Stenotrophomonas maltophilia group sp. RNC7]|uniref:hypothetical protein n=1 Tax=Stenotrophomonas maltophilia group sp. RNC7 TaxID=3071467 RepID=UPI0027E1128E|nr:hypothetical protein [Stenotrophomonas maltophilia group sp. RNC7]MDQ4681880.1 hypothetical protein [Stenotrophomonas maltophilia group sp. RNC7]
MNPVSNITPSEAVDVRAAFAAYLSDESVRHVPEIPFGGTTGDLKTDQRLCTFAFNAKGSPDPVAYLRDIARALMDRAVERRSREIWAEKCLVRIAEWLAFENTDGSPRFGDTA